jgi:hypothetical protein
MTDVRIVEVDPREDPPDGEPQRRPPLRGRRL